MLNMSFFHKIIGIITVFGAYTYIFAYNSLSDFVYLYYKLTSYLDGRRQNYDIWIWKLYF